MEVLWWKITGQLGNGEDAIRFIRCSFDRDLVELYASEWKIEHGWSSDALVTNIHWEEGRGAFKLLRMIEWTEKDGTEIGGKSESSGDDAMDVVTNAMQEHSLEELR